MKTLLNALVTQAIAGLREAGTLPADVATPDFVVERPRERSHGDFSTNAAMLLARPARSNPRALAQALVAALPPSADIAKVEIAGPGFINFRFTPKFLLHWLQRFQTTEALQNAASNIYHGRRIVIDFYYDRVPITECQDVAVQPVDEVLDGRDVVLVERIHADLDGDVHGGSVIVTASGA